jgi:type II secretory pathway component GspD/PulD (secretin)
MLLCLITRASFFKVILFRNHKIRCIQHPVLVLQDKIPHFLPVLRLEITPHVIDGKNLKMKVEVKKDEVDTSRNVGGNPYIYKKKTNPNLIVRDGETIVISGLTKQKRQDAETGIPWLKDIPVLGWLFKSEGKSETMQEVLIFSTPNILPVQSVAAVPAAPEKPLENRPAAEVKK